MSDFHSHRPPATPRADRTPRAIRHAWRTRLLDHLPLVLRLPLGIAVAYADLRAVA